MMLYLIQHGISVPEEQDPKKPLSEEGKTETRETARFLKERGVKVDSIWHSAKTRSVQTAQIISEAVTHSKIAERDDLNPNDPVNKLQAELKKLNTDVMIVGHLPFLPKLASALLAGTENPGLISFRNSGVVCLEFREKEGWRLSWSLPPEMM